MAANTQTIDDLIRSNLQEIIKSSPNSYAAYVAQVTINAMNKETKNG